MDRPLVCPFSIPVSRGGHYKAAVTLSVHLHGVQHFLSLHFLSGQDRTEVAEPSLGHYYLGVLRRWGRAKPMRSSAW